jgi:hypothetical protein
MGESVELMMKINSSPRDSTKLFKDMFKVNLYYALQILGAVNKKISKLHSPERSDPAYRRQARND